MKNLFRHVNILWFKIPDKLRFLFVGGFNALVAYIVFCLLILAFGEVHRQGCLALQWFLTSFVSFYTQKKFVFKSNGNFFKEYLKCCATWFVGYLINVIFLEVFMYFHLSVFVAQILAVAVTSVCTYILFKYWALIKKSKD